MVTWARRVVADRRFNAFIIGVILVNAALVGLETAEDLLARHGTVFELVNGVVIAIFVVEIAFRVTSYWPRPHAFFRDPSS
jgi:voltage-gated sodium channel